MFDHKIAIRPYDVLPRHSRTTCWLTMMRPASLSACLIGFLWIVAASPPLKAEPPVDGNATADEKTTTPESAASEALTEWQSTGLPLMQAYCVDCHNEDVQEGGLDLSPFETLSDLTTAEVKRVLEMVRFGAMPPEDYDTPEIEERKLLVSSLEATMYSSTCDLTPRAGKVTVRRLNRSEYNNTIRDLFGMDLRPADRFPSDEVGAGFDNNGDVLSLSPMLIEKFIEAAEHVSQNVIVDPDDLPVLRLEVPGDQIPIYGEPKIGSFSGRFVDGDSFAWIDLEAPFDGDYRIDVRGGATSKERGRVNVAICDASGTLLATDGLDYFGGGGSADSMNETIELSKGKHRLIFVPVLDDRELKVGETKFESVTNMDPERVKSILAKRGKPVSVERGIDSDEFPFMFRSFKVNGPGKHPSEAYPPKQFEVVRHIAPKKRNRYYDVEKVALKNLTPLMHTVFRGPVTDDEVRPYAQLVEQSVKDGASYHRATQIALSAILVSPRFLFRVETPPADSQPNAFGDVPLSQHQLATRLSYFLWSSTPDQTLLEQADRDQLDVDRLKGHVERMLADQKADAMASDFAAQWLGLRNLTEHEADGKRFPTFDDPLKSAMVRETEALFLHILRHNLPVGEFLTADYTFVDPSLARHYGLTVDESKARDQPYQKVSLSGTPRRGLLSHASVLTLTSTPNRTSPVLRGKWILENILGTKAPDPPAGVPELEDGETAGDNATLREQLELHRQSPSCASCHRVMDQLGFGLDDFDAIGQFRTEEGGKPIDASGALPDGRSFNGGAELSGMLAETEIEGLARTLTERLLTFAIGRELTPDDRCTIDEIIEHTRGNQFRLADLVTEVVLSRQFRFQTYDADATNR
ncbi:hypothetical protein Mal15_46510 [Stieleria maiorica]|uniref:Planctomycete cytochrome C n=2 Tax=Stieleria maiorica TaxID=2795974 RepID=A0A5B9MJF9_9BACT|nr:hypothetical protein Mal15_46510 [Stieleria maiorica]